MSRSLVCVALLVFSASHLKAAETQPLEFAAKCGVDLGKAAESDYADPPSKGWKRYTTLQGIPELQNDTGELARVWVSQTSKTIVLTEASGEDFYAYHSYCFDRSGALTRLEYQPRTAWGWAYVEERPLSHAQKVSKRFIDENDGKEIPAPEQAADLEEALKPEVYDSLDKLPFYSLMNSRKVKR